MLNRPDELSSPEKIISDNLTHKPSVSQSVFNNFSMSTIKAYHGISSFGDEYNQSPEGKTVQANFDMLKRDNENPEVGWTQWGANQVADMLGQSLNPMTWVFGEVGSLAMKPVTALASRFTPATSMLRQPIAKIMGEPASKYIPETIGTDLEKKDLSFALIGKNALTGFGVGAGVTLPQATIDNFNSETGKHDFLGIAKEMGAGGMLGLTLSPIPVAWGMLKHNIFRRTGIDVGNVPPGGSGGGEREPFQHEEALKQAVKDGKLSQESFDFWLEMQELDKENLKGKSTEFIASKGNPVDYATQTAQFQILNRDQINNLQSATLDQLVSDHIPQEQRTALTDFTVQAAIDDMRNKPELLDGVRGYVDYVSDRLNKKDEVLAKADELVDQHFNMPHTESEMPLSHYDMVKAIEKVGKNNPVPFVIPDNVNEYVKIQNQISSMEDRNKKLFKQYEETGDDLYTKRMKDNARLIEEYKKKLPKLLSPIEELKDIRETLLPSDESKFKTSYPFDSKNVEILTSKYGEMKFHYNFEDKDITEGYRKDNIPAKSAHVKYSKINDKYKGRGLGKKMYIMAMKHAMSKGLTYVSDTILSDDAMKMYRSLERMGFKFEENKNIIENNMAGGNQERWVARDGKPIFKLLSMPDNINVKTKVNKNLTEYFRLEELAEIWHPAKTLLDRVNLEDNIQKQEAYRDLAKQMLEIADNNIGAQADINKVRDYLDLRTKQKIEEPKAESMVEVTEANKVPADHEIIIAETDRRMDSLTHEKVKEEYEVAKEKLDEFKKSEGIFKSMINCLLGANG